jgi:DNA-directed RNA polymerase specialized sigma24 family protein
MNSLTRQLTEFDRSAAEELVHDAYVDLATGRTDIQSASNLDGYLYRVLRSLNASRIKRAYKHEHDALDILEFDSIRPRRSFDCVYIEQRDSNRFPFWNSCKKIVLFSEWKTSD